MTVAAEETRLLDPTYIDSIARGLLRACAQYLSTQYQDMFALVDPAPITDPDIDIEPPPDIAAAHAAAAGIDRDFEIEDAMSLRQADLTIINGIGPVRNSELADFGISSLATLAALSAADIDACAQALNLPSETIAEWSAEAKSL